MSPLRSAFLILCLILGGWLITGPVLGEDVVIHSLAGAEPTLQQHAAATVSPAPGSPAAAQDEPDVKGTESLVDSGIRFVDLIGEVRVYTPCLNIEENPATLSTVLHIGDYIYTGEWGQAIMQLPGSIKLTLLRDSEFIVGVATDCNTSETSAKVIPETGPTLKPEIIEPNQTAPDPAPEPTVTAEPTVQPEGEAGDTVSLPIGETYTVSLPQNPTTGFMWETEISDGLTIQNDIYIPDQHPPGWVGGGGTREWTILAIQEGKQTFSAIKRRSWEPVTGDEDTHIVEFMVTAGTPADSVPPGPAPAISPSLTPTGDMKPVTPTATVSPEIPLESSGNADQASGSAEISPEEKPDEGSGCEWGGTWDTSYETMQMVQTGTSVSGTYDYKSGQITGTVKGKNLSGTWQETEGTETNHGPVQLTMSDDCDSFTGQWKHEGSEYWNGHWTGKRVSGKKA